MTKGKEARVIVILECISCVQNDFNKKSSDISRYITEKLTQYIRSSRIEKILSLLSQAYHSW